MIFNVRKTVQIFLPALTLIGIFLSSLSFLYARSTRVILMEKLIEIEVNQTSKNKESSVLGKTTPQSDEEIQESYNQQNKELKERSFTLSPSKIKAAYFQNKSVGGAKDLSDEDYTSVIIEEDGKQESVFQGDFHVSDLEWLNDREIVVYRSCGTECMVAYIVDTKTKHQQELALGVGYTWSPNKQYVAVYHFSYEYGISIANRGNKYGQTIFQLRRKHPPNGSSLTDETQVAWSPTSARLAVVIKKDNEEKLELIILDIQKDFKNIYQQDLTNTSISGLTWEGENTVVVTDTYGSKKIPL